MRQTLGPVIGQDGKSVNVEKDGNTLIVYQEGDEENAVVFTDIKGDKGDTGATGTSIEYDIDDVNNLFRVRSVNSDGTSTEWETFNFNNLKGPKGDKGDTGPQGPAATGVQTDNFYYFGVDDDPNSDTYGYLYVYCEEDAEDTGFYYDTDTGILYKEYDTNNRISLGNVQGPATLIDNTDINNRLGSIEDDITSLETSLESLTTADLINRINSLEARLTELEAEETAQNNLLGVN